jgi:hypothetical protein
MKKLNTFTKFNLHTVRIIQINVFYQFITQNIYIFLSYAL